MRCATRSRATSAAPNSASPPLARRVAAAELDELRRVASLVVGGASSSSSSAARADAALIPGVLFVSDFALHFSSDRPARVTPHGRAGGDYVRVSLPFERIARVTPHVDGAERWIGAVTVDAHRFWFTGFASFDDARTAVGRAGEAFLAKSAQHAREEGGGWWGEGGGAREEEEVEGEGERVGAAREGAARRARPKNPARRRCPRRDDKGAEVTRERHSPRIRFRGRIPSYQ